MRNYEKNYKKIEHFAVKYMNIIKCELKDFKSDLALLKFFDKESPFMNPNKPYSPPKSKNKEIENDKGNENKGKENEENQID